MPIVKYICCYSVYLLKIGLDMKKSLVLASLVLLGASQSMHGMDKWHGKAFKAAGNGVLALYGTNVLMNSSLCKDRFADSRKRQIAWGAAGVAAVISYCVKPSKGKTTIFNMMRNGAVAGYGTKRLMESLLGKDDSRNGKIAWTAGIVAGVGSLFCGDAKCGDEKKHGKDEEETDKIQSAFEAYINDPKMRKELFQAFKNSKEFKALTKKTEKRE